METYRMEPLYYYADHYLHYSTVENVTVDILGVKNFANATKSGNGPFTLSAWTHNASMTFTKNPNWCDART